MYRSIKDIDFKTPKKVFKSPRDWRDEVIYHLMIDRFDNNDPSQTLANLTTGDSARTSPVGTVQGDTFKGGKIAGITRRLDYIKSLGCTAIWISPPFKNRQHCNKSYHGYGIQNYLEIDPRFGTKEELQQLIREAHKRKMYVIIDVVLNHTGDNWEYASGQGREFSKNGKLRFGNWRDSKGELLSHTARGLGPEDAVWPIEFQTSDCYHRLGAIDDYEDEYQTRMGDLKTLKDLDHGCQEVLKSLIACYKWWISQLDCDGFRIDAVKHSDPKAVSIFVNAIRDYSLKIGKKNFLFLAEVIGDDDEILQYIGMNQTAADEPLADYPHFTACLDFPLYFLLEDVLKGRKPWTALQDRYSNLQQSFRDFTRAGNYFVTFLENHDQVGRAHYRFMHGEEDERLAMLGIGYLILSMGIPCLYYGTEQGLNGGGDGDHFVRETMFASDWGGRGIRAGHLFNDQGEIFRYVAKLAALRRSEPALKYGRQYFVATFPDEAASKDNVHPHVFAFVRVLDDTSFLIVMNTSNQPQDCLIELNPDRFLLSGDHKSILDENNTLTPIAVRKSIANLSMQPRTISVFKSTVR
jgi:glycosidase